MKIPENLKYTRDHEWIDDEGRVGITDYAQESLGDVVFVELPQVGQVVKTGEAFGVVESVKSVSDLYSPVDGTVTAVNEALNETPELINQDPYNQGWIIQVDVQGYGEELLDAKAYQQQVEGE
ncbi:glycine cleavage system protein GcvH [Sulfobacillus thermosulfidooxidans]|uniref:glycine cleavage system protein GcvH n=1 Tax=Sulfobacillus thermosulfidooxidans TaxID=28034 RepID=UPI0006B5CE52|nr:glycine cleavage system protein GcvH [Sulfobacillus thermosulfidooxidans]